MVRLVLGMACVCLSTVSRAERLHFECIWEQAIPTIIEVDTGRMTATRSDGGRPFQVIQVSQRGVWLLVPDPDKPTVEIIQRLPPGGISGGGGTLTMVDMSWDGQVEPRVAGVCQEK